MDDEATFCQECKSCTHGEMTCQNCGHDLTTSTTSRDARWDCHKHKSEMFVSGEHTVCHPEQGVLCYWFAVYGSGRRLLTFFPIRFNSNALAQKWIDSGCIADIQESLSILEVGFSNVLIQILPSRPWDV